MTGIKIAARNKNLPDAQPKDEVLSTDLVTLPIESKKKFSIKLNAGVTYGYIAAEVFPVATIPHGLPFAPLFRGWIETVSLTTGEKTGQKYSIPIIRSADLGFYAIS